MFQREMNALEMLRERNRKQKKENIPINTSALGIQTVNQICRTMLYKIWRLQTPKRNQFDIWGRLHGEKEARIKVFFYPFLDVTGRQAVHRTELPTH